ncbi:ATP synthase F0 subunit 6 [Phlyctochytrium arcticum]|nr:ATP synthase F0 subunit 6 [Phlyctochytrium arcticum]KAI9088694.1 ATP synthase F0 subunit 6 [Phlyctochytrium arcticum]
MMSNFLVFSSPMEQYEIYPVIQLLNINNVNFALLVAAFISIILTYIGTVRGEINMVENYIGPKFTIYLPLLYTIMAITLLFGILIIGFLSHKQYLFAAFLPAGTPLGLVPLMIALEVLSYGTRALSLGLRLAVNMITGHILVKVIVGFIWAAYLKGTSLLVLSLPLLLLTLFLALELLIAYLQAYIFVFITCITFKDMAK